VAKLQPDRLEKKRQALLAERDRSPVLVALGVEIKARRGRFYLERESELLGRITPLEGRQIRLVLESPHRSSWLEIARGGPSALMQAVASDNQGTFHGLGALNAAMVERGQMAQVSRMKGKTPSFFPITGEGETSSPPPYTSPQQALDFCYQDDTPAALHEVLFYYLGIPVAVLIEPRDWYCLHRRPAIVEMDVERQRVLVSFQASSWSGESFGGRCLYMLLQGRWACFKIRPNQSQDIDSALNWLQKRGWVGWR